MITLHNDKQIASFYIGEFVNDDLNASFHAYEIVTLSYSDFMAFFYQLCNVTIDCDNNIKFVIGYTAFCNGTNNALEFNGKPLKMIHKILD